MARPRIVRNRVDQCREPINESSEVQLTPCSPEEIKTKKSFFSFVTKNMATNNSRALVYGAQIIFRSSPPSERRRRPLSKGLNALGRQ
jgi:hypothetical protein